MIEKFDKVTAAYKATESIYVKADGKTVCGQNDKDVAFLKFGVNAVITPAQHAALIFPDAGTPEPTPDAEQRSAEVLPDAEKRTGGKHKAK